MILILKNNTDRNNSLEKKMNRINSLALLDVSLSYFQKNVWEKIEPQFHSTWRTIYGLKEYNMSRKSVAEELYRELVIEKEIEPSIEEIKNLLIEWNLSEIYQRKDLGVVTAYRRTMIRHIEEMAE